ncbi:MAG: hypothetical protein M0T84_05130 [Betaproteobacteria bacterium]|nr:hypothetical protein [Betaproteobacteria bacterium]
MEPDRELLDAFVDGELPPKEMAQIAAVLTLHPDLDGYVRLQEKLRIELRSVYHLTFPMPERLVKLIGCAPVSWRWRLRAWCSSRYVVRSLVASGAALAVGLVVSFVIRPTGDIGIDAAGRPIAQRRLSEALNTELVSNGYAGTGPRIGVSYRNKSGMDCRTFTEGVNAGLACHERGTWVIDALVKQEQENSGTAYRMAGSEMPDAVRRAVAASIDGAPFDAQKEKAARDSGWLGHHSVRK